MPCVKLDLELIVRDTLVESGNVLLGRFKLDLRRIVRLGNVQLMLIDTLPINSLFLSTDNGYYITEQLFIKLKSLGLIPVASRFVEEDEMEGNDPASIREKMLASMEALSVARSETATALDGVEGSKKVLTRSTALAKLEKVLPFVVELFAAAQCRPL